MINTLTLLWSVAAGVFAFGTIVWMLVNARSLSRQDVYVNLVFCCVVYSTAAIFGSLDFEALFSDTPDRIFRDGGLGSPRTTELLVLVLSGFVSAALGMVFIFLHSIRDIRQQGEEAELQKRTPLRDFKALLEEYGYDGAMDILRRKRNGR